MNRSVLVHQLLDRSPAAAWEGRAAAYRTADKVVADIAVVHRGEDTGTDIEAADKPAAVADRAVELAVALAARVKKWSPEQMAIASRLR